MIDPIWGLRSVEKIISKIVQVLQKLALARDLLGKLITSLWKDWNGPTESKRKIIPFVLTLILWLYQWWLNIYSHSFLGIEIKVKALIFRVYDGNKVSENMYWVFTRQDSNLVNKIDIERRKTITERGGGWEAKNLDLEQMYRSRPLDFATSGEGVLLFAELFLPGCKSFNGESLVG